jgi:hypothetical protein
MFSPLSYDIRLDTNKKLWYRSSDVRYMLATLYRNATPHCCISIPLAMILLIRHYDCQLATD